jgi:catechol 2,3-dioxygenase-like lactoylglutathione lyase family enzyme
VVVPDYDAAIDWFVRVLGFVLLEDIDQGDGKRWVRVATSVDAGTALLLARPTRPHSGRASATRPVAGSAFSCTPTISPATMRRCCQGRALPRTAAPRGYGSVAVFRDPYGNRWDLLEPAR